MSNSEKNKNFWKSLRDYHDDPEVLKLKANEFKDGVTDDFDPSELSGLSRRKFLALLTASAAFTATACTDYRDKGEIIPYNKRPAELLPGTPNYYSSTCTGCSSHCGIIIKTREGRPIKIEGNPDHPINRGKICSKGQASILDLYDPDRISYPLFRRSKISWDKVDSEISGILKKAVENGKEVALLTNSVFSPTQAKLFRELKTAFSAVEFYKVDAINNLTKKDAWQACYDQMPLPGFKIENAQLIVSFDSDFLGSEGAFIENSAAYASARDVKTNGSLSRHYAIESGMTMTGMNADYRLKMRPEAMTEFLAALVNEVIRKTDVSDEFFGVSFKGADIASIAGKYNLDKIKVEYLLSDLIKYSGKGLVIGGDHLAKDDHILINLLNELLGNQAQYDFSKSYASESFSDVRSLEKLEEGINSGKITAVIHYDVNPVYTLPPAYKYHELLKKVDDVITLTSSENESSALSNYILPINHQFESWGDYYARNGVYSLQQPVIMPIFNSRQREGILLSWIQGKFRFEAYHEYLIKNFEESIYTKSGSTLSGKNYWYASLHDGVVSLPDDQITFKRFNIAVLPSEVISAASGISLVLKPGFNVYDGRFANNGWLQEIPHPVSKVAWDNYAAVSPKFATENGLKNNDVIELISDEFSIKIPVLEQPGNDDNTITVELGYGRQVCGEVGKEVGKNAFILVGKNSDKRKYVRSGVKIQKTGDTLALASTQEHHSLDDDSVKDIHLIRNIIREGTLEEYKKNKHFLHHEKHEIFSITAEQEYSGLKWGMTIDLNKCTGCTACITSCNIENNIPVVGKDQVLRGREMHWMRIDRYYSGTPDEPVISNQPMLCQHCDNAPCENVCPVNATNHSPDGLNQMAYNRCVGTRYCSNNCPFKVRRFNFYNFRDHFADAYYHDDLFSLLNNPEVTVRSRGVMEKCTFCIQRIMDARSEAIKDNRTLKGTDVKTACQTACPSEAIYFGDLNDKQSDVAKHVEHDLAYHVLDYLNVRPNVTYIAKLRNTHSEEA